MKSTCAPVFFTICSKNLLGYAKTCMESVRKHHPDSDLYIFLADRSLGPKPEFDESNIQVVTLEEHGGLGYRDMMFRYNITEFNTSIKPYCFLHLFGQYQRDTNVVYLDPDTWVQSPLLEVVDAFDNGSNAVLIPHMTEPLGFGNLPDRTLLRYGAYNFGFVGLKNTEHNEEIVCWWADELKDYCVIDYENGLFVDQKYGDLFPSFIPDTKILRHNGYNVAYWNLFSRTFDKNDNGDIFVNGEPLRFVHFSGASLKNETDFISRHCTTLMKKHRKVYGELLDDWSEQLEVNQHSVHLKQGYSFFWNSAHKENEHTPEEKKENDQIVLFQRNQWLFMLQFTQFDVYENWMKRESTVVENQIKNAENNSQLQLFCNTCFNWSIKTEWNKDKCSCCESSSTQRLINAFLYQELKLVKSNLVGVVGDNGFEESGLCEPYREYTIELEDKRSENQFPDELNSKIDYLVLTENIEDVFNSASGWMEKSNWPHILIGVQGSISIDNNRVLTNLLEKLNIKEDVRASLFIGLSANHAMNGSSQALIYIENLRFEVLNNRVTDDLSKIAVNAD